MCGIAGIINRNGQIDQDDLASMVERLAHRGPDDSGTFVQDRVGFGHTRLSIIDISGGHQPLRDKDQRLTLVANGEVYNYVELTAELQSLGRSFTTRSDSETILHAYAVHGEDFAHHLNGMFAFALYDAQRQMLILGRDRLGIKPLYYLVLPNRVAFASEIKALLPLLPGPPQIDPSALLQYLQLQYNTGEQTLIQGIRRLPPGELLFIDRDLGLRRQRYWSLLDVTERDRDFPEAEAEFEDLIDQVMTEHVRSDVPYALFLSGGVDSSILLALLSRYQDRPLRTFSVGFSTTIERDELPHAERVAGMFSTEHTALVLDQDALFQRSPHMVWAADDLVRDYAMLPTSFLAEGAGRDVKVVFTGEGGDEAFAGYPRYWRPRSVKNRLRALLWPGTGGLYTKGSWRYSEARGVFGNRLKDAQRGFRTPFIDLWSPMPESWSRLQRRQYLDISTWLADDLLVKADRMLMAFAVEGRVPFVDHRIVEFGLSLPDTLKVGDGAGKLFLKRWAERHLPREHLQLPKQGFTVPVKRWLHGDFLESLSKKLPRNPAIREWFQPDGVRSLLETQRRRGNRSREVWGLMQFAIWHRIFVEGDGAAPPLMANPIDWIS